jgi:hypothetical protein
MDSRVSWKAGTEPVDMMVDLSWEAVKPGARRVVLPVSVFSIGKTLSLGPGDVSSLGCSLHFDVGVELDDLC